MIQDGVFGHAGSTSPQTPGIAYWLPVEGGDIARAIRGYNTGSIIDANDLANIVATDPMTGKKYFAGTQAYVSDVANRMTGARDCHTRQRVIWLQPRTITSLMLHVQLAQRNRSSALYGVKNHSIMLSY